MLVLTDLADTLQTLFTTEADDAARETGFHKRRRCLDGPRFAQTLTFGWLHRPDATLEDLADLAADLGADISPQALDQRLTPVATHFLARLLSLALHRAFEADPVAVPLLQRFAGVYLYDTTTVTLTDGLRDLFPGCGGSTPADGQAALKVHVELEMLRGGLDLDVGPGRHPDAASLLARRPLPPGSLRLGDRAFFNLTVFQDLEEAGSYWISRLPTCVRVESASGRQGKIAVWLAGCAASHVDETVWVGGVRLKCRLLARRVPPAIAARRREQARRHARRKGVVVSPAQLELCAWNVCLTNLPEALLSAAEAWVLLRLRWQIELLFKAWKSQGGLAFSRGRRPERVLCEIYAKLLGLLVQHWLVVASVGAPLGWSYPKVGRQVRRQAPRLVWLLVLGVGLMPLLEEIGVRARRRARLSARPRRPTTAERLRDPVATGRQDDLESGPPEPEEVLAA